MNTILRAYQPSIRRYRGLLCMVLLFMALGMVLEICRPYLLRELVELFSLQEKNSSAVKNTFLWLAILIGSTMGIWRCFDYAIAFFEAKVMHHLDQRSFGMLQMQSMRFFENSFAGSLVKQVSRFRNAFEGLADALFFQLGRNAILIILTLGIFIWEYPVIGLMFSVWILIFISLNIAAAIWKYPLDAAEAISDTKVSGALADSLSNHATVKSYGMERYEQNRFNAVIAHNYAARMRAWMMSNHVTIVQGVSMACFELAMIWVMILGWEQGAVTVGDFVFFQTYVLWLFENLWGFGNTIRRVFQFLADAEEMAGIYALVPDVQDRDHATDIHISDGTIAFTDVIFSYNAKKDAHHADIKPLSLTIPSGQSVALVGPSGAGKTTIVKLLMRFFDATHGSITIDGQDVREVTQESLRQNIALVPQQPELFHRSLRDNIAFARPEALEEEIITAAKRAHAWEFITQLPDGLETLVGERGVKLSGGERQRIALARAFLTNAPILILDEATSALDSVTEKLIQDAIADLLQDRTSIVIAHRLSTIMVMDRIIVLDDGQIIEQGTHEELLHIQGIYATLWNHQSGGYLG